MRVYVELVFALTDEWEAKAQQGLRIPPGAAIAQINEILSGGAPDHNGPQFVEEERSVNAVSDIFGERSRRYGRVRRRSGVNPSSPEEPTKQ